MPSGILPVRQLPDVEAERGPVVYQNLDTNINMFGGAKAKALSMLAESITGFGNAIDDKDKQKSINDTLEAYQGTKDKIRDYLYNPETGVYSKTGKNASGSGQAFTMFSDQLMADALNNIKDPKAKEAFQKNVAYGARHHGRWCRSS